MHSQAGLAIEVVFGRSVSGTAGGPVGKTS